ncbi:MAG: hypothetical protein JHC33_03380 [Ignisphaera sp.]|nr:hypothetical protein [Ignisphaera sp.]
MEHLGDIFDIVVVLVIAFYVISISVSYVFTKIGKYMLNRWFEKAYKKIEKGLLK